MPANVAIPNRTEGRSLFSRRSLLAGTGAILLAGPFASPTRAAAQSIAVVTPEDHGAAGDGVSDDAPALARALAEAASSGRPLSFRAGRTYAVGSRGWRGFSVRGAAGLRLLGNGATIQVMRVPTQHSGTGNGNPVFAFVGCRDLHLSGLKFQFSRLAADGFGLHQCSDYEIIGCDFRNSQGTAGYEHAIKLTASRNGRIENCTGASLFMFVYAGHTDPGSGCTGLEIIGNRVSAMKGDPIIGFMQDVLIDKNAFDGFFGIGFANDSRAKGGTSTSSNIRITNNDFRNAVASLIQTDVDPKAAVHDVVISGNRLERAGVNGIGVQAVGAVNWVISDNTIIGCENGIFVDRAQNVQVVNNRISGAGARTKRRGISVTTVSGNTSGVTVSGNVVEGYADAAGSGYGIFVEKSNHQLRTLDVARNTARGSRINLYVGGSLDGSIRENSLESATGLDLQVGHGGGRARGLGSNRFRTQAGLTD